MKVHLSRWVCLDAETNLRRARAEARAAAAGGAELVVFPELFLTGYSRTLEPARARSEFLGVSAEHPEVLFIFGSINEGPYNRVTAWTEGSEIGAYDKVHLFRPNLEHERWRAGDRYRGVAWRGLAIGLMNCNDIRFPEQARALRLAGGCELLVIPAWWPWRRDHVWRTLLRARAIENGVWVLGCCIAGSVADNEDFAGAGNHVFDPIGDPVSTNDDVMYDLAIDHAPRPVVDPVDEAVAIDRVEIMGCEETS